MKYFICLGLIMLVGCLSIENKFVSQKENANISNLDTTGMIEIPRGKKVYVGTVWAIDKDILVTAQHVCSAAKNPNDFIINYLILNRPYSETGGRIIYQNANDDVCFIKFENHGIVPLNIGSSSLVAGERIQVTGAPGGFWPFTTFGYFIKNDMIYGIGNRLLLSNPCTHGSSGSPMINQDGEIVGMILNTLDYDLICAGLSMNTIQIDFDSAKKALKKND